MSGADAHEPKQSAIMVAIIIPNKTLFLLFATCPSFTLLNVLEPSFFTHSFHNYSFAFIARQHLLTNPYFLHRIPQQGGNRYRCPHNPADKSLPIEEKSCGDAACEKSKEEKKQKAKMRFAAVVNCT